MKKIFLILLSLLSLQAMSQTDSTDIEKPKKFDPSRLVFGGSFGASFGDFTFVQLTPQVGYRFTDYFTAGAGINFVHSSAKYDYVNPAYKSSYGYAGMNLFARAYPLRFLVVSAQPELNYSWGKINYSSDAYPDLKMESKFVPSLLVGGGVMLGSGGRGGMMVSMQYDVIQHSRSPYGTKPFLNISFVF